MSIYHPTYTLHELVTFDDKNFGLAHCLYAF